MTGNGMVVRWLVRCNNLNKEIATHAFGSPTRQKEEDLTTHILNDITGFWDICMLNAYGFQIRNNIFVYIVTVVEIHRTP